MPLLRRPPAYFSALPARQILIFLFITQVVSVALLIGFLSFYNSRIAVNQVARQLQAEVSARIEQHLQDFFGMALRLNELNSEMVLLGLVAPDNVSFMQTRYLALMKSFDEPSSIYFGTPEGGIVGAGREVTGELYVTETPNLRAGDFVKTIVDEDGNRLGVASSFSGFDATTRPWYTRSVQSQQSGWSDVFIRFTGEDVAVAASAPVYAADGSLLGVVSVDISAAHLTSYLQSLQIGKTGMAFVIDRSGQMVASSLAENVVVASQGDTLARITAVQSPDPTIRSTALFLSTHFGDFQSIGEQAQLHFSASGEDHFVQITPNRDVYGPDWLTVVVIPEADFMAQIDRNLNLTILLSILAMLISVVVAMVLAQKMSQPMQQLAASTRQVGEGQWTQLNHRSRVLEFQELINAYNQMVVQLQKTMEKLSTEVMLRRQTEEILRENEERLSLIVEGAQLGTWDWQVQSGEVNFNRRWAEMLGYEPQELAPHIDTWKQLVHPQDMPIATKVLEAHLRGETPNYQLEHRLRTKNGEWKWILDVGLVVEFDDQGNPMRAAGIHQDISERKTAEEALLASHEELEATLHELQETQQRMMQQERLAAVGQLAAGIAHDFNNVLTSILMYSQLSLSDTSLDPKLQRRLSVIVEQTRQGAELVQQILDFGRATVMRLSPLDLSTIVEDGVQLARRTLSSSIEIAMELPAQPLYVQADATRIHQALLNLFFNARDAMNGGGKVYVMLTLCDQSADGIFVCAECGVIYSGRWARISVTDEGSGIPPQHLPHIFEPFFTSKGAQGHGLGLAQVHGIVKQHGGHLSVETQLGHGTTFFLYFPLDESAQITSPLLTAEPSVHTQTNPIETKEPLN